MYSGYGWNIIKNDSNEIVKMVEWLSKQLSIRKLEDWYKLPISQINRQFQFETKDLVSALQTVHPHHHWDVAKFQGHDFVV